MYLQTPLGIDACPMWVQIQKDCYVSPSYIDWAPATKWGPVFLVRSPDDQLQLLSHGDASAFMFRVLGFSVLGFRGL